MSLPLYENLLNTLSTESDWTKDNETALLEPFDYISANPGKDMRSRLIQAFNLWLKVPEDKTSLIARIVTMLHNASLLVDDIEDDSQLRRGQPVAHKIYGVPQTINTANYVYFLAFKELRALHAREEKDCDTIVTEELLSLHRGQGLELQWRDSLQCPSEEQYIGMVNNKTGGLLRIGIKLMMACATVNTETDYVPLVNLIGVYFQIRDDLMNLQSPDYASNKGFAEDLTEGKFSFPVVHGIHADTTNRQVMNVLQKRPTTPTLKHHVIGYLKDHTKSFAYTLDVLDILEGRVRGEIARLGGNEGLSALMDYLTIDRTAFE
ncbi:terpenoid synthase [Cylindrobasidium torrendii FP15055 ss-10]|uniref:(2E,6E)-farnesyl diphosphate synthase n=1 Tax=Cylindrobasidium torrendii FP15055 ss-10 TaxID=1314674 RepID=A0A0D7B905_9AGAR|nr:terpenoid synthase [Cylindrobasidium torrendii FP15055 ss-10]